MENSSDIDYLQSVLNKQGTNVDLSKYSNQPFIYNALKNYSQQFQAVQKQQSIQNFALQNTINHFMNQVTIRRQQINNNISNRNIQGGLGNLILHQQDLAQANQTTNIITQSYQQNSQLQSNENQITAGITQLLATAKPSS